MLDEPRFTNAGPIGGSCSRKKELEASDALAIPSEYERGLIHPAPGKSDT
jgi:hypothetical protein